MEGLQEELDAPNEYYFDNQSKVLSFNYNGSGSPPSLIVIPTEAQVRCVVVTALLYRAHDTRVCVDLYSPRLGGRSCHQHHASEDDHHSHTPYLL